MKISLPPALRLEAAANLRLAGPLVAAQMTFIGFGVIDTLMAGRISGVALAAVAVGHAIWTVPFMGFLGICTAISPIVAHRIGAGQPLARIGAFARQALVLAAGLGVAWWLLVRMIARPIIDRLGLPAATADLTETYLYAESTSAFAFALCFAQRNLLEGQGFSRPILFNGLCGLAVKLAFNAGFVHGRFGLPALGVVGCGWGTVAATAAMAAIYAGQLATLRRVRGLRLFAPGWRPRAEVLEVLRLGVPIGCILVAEAGLFGVGALMMARFGALPVAAHQIALNFASIVFMVPLGLGMATTVRVGQALGAGRRADARLAGQTGMGLGLAFALFSAALMGLAPQWITGLYTDDPAVTPLAQTFLRFAALFQLFDCLQATANGALRGLKETRVPLAITLGAYWLVGMPIAVGLAFHAGVGPVGIWWGFIGGLAAAALGLSLRFLNRTAGGSVVMP